MALGRGQCTSVSFLGTTKSPQLYCCANLGSVKAVGGQVVW